MRTCKHFGGKINDHFIFCKRLERPISACACDRENCAYWTQAYRGKDERTKQRIYDYIADYIKNNGYSPAIREICEGAGLKSTSTVHGYLRKLKQDGMIDFRDTLPRTIRIKV